VIPSYLECSDDYRNMPDSERDASCGCGTKKSWMVPDSMWGLSIKQVCCIHDYDYSKGKTQGDRERADYRFLRNLMETIDRAPGFWNSLMRMPRRRRALKYYEAVNRFGDEAFWANKLTSNEETAAGR
jgi:hypothetical protein